MKDELFRKPRSHNVSACFEQPIFSNVSKLIHFDSVVSLCRSEHCRFLDASLYPLYTEPDICPVQAESCPSGSKMGWSQSGAISMSPVSYLPLPACFSLDLCFCPHDGVLLSEKSLEPRGKKKVQDL